MLTRNSGAMASFRRDLWLRMESSDLGRDSRGESGHNKSIRTVALRLMVFAAFYWMVTCVFRKSLTCHMNINPLKNNAQLDITSVKYKLLELQITGILS